MIKIVFILFLLTSFIYSDSYNFDAIEKSKNDQLSSVDISTDDYIKDANKNHMKVKKDYYYKYTLPAQRAAQARAMKQAKARQNAGINTQDCMSIQINCENHCKSMRNQFVFLGSSDRSRCKSHCVSAFSLCNNGLLRETKIELCKSNCEIFIDSNGGVLKKSDREKCYGKCDDKY